MTDASGHSRPRNELSDQEWTAINADRVAEFRRNGGSFSGPGLAGQPALLLTTIGRRTGQERVQPLVYQPNGDQIIIFATKGGNRRPPAWYLNLLVTPRATVEVGTEVYEVEATVLTGVDRDRVWNRQKELVPGFAQYEEISGREIPVVALRRI
jgi:deazaflavin-dependent oxidoreductase (nitroreductase family)